MLGPFAKEKPPLPVVAGGSNRRARCVSIPRQETGVFGFQDQGSHVWTSCDLGPKLHCVSIASQPKSDTMSLSRWRHGLSIILDPECCTNEFEVFSTWNTISAQPFLNCGKRNVETTVLDQSDELPDSQLPLVEQPPQVNREADPEVLRFRIQFLPWSRGHVCPIPLRFWYRIVQYRIYRIGNLGDTCLRAVA